MTRKNSGRKRGRGASAALAVVLLVTTGLASPALAKSDKKAARGCQLLAKAYVYPDSERPQAVYNAYDGLLLLKKAKNRQIRKLAAVVLSSEDASSTADIRAWCMAAYPGDPIVQAWPAAIP